MAEKTARSGESITLDAETFKRLHAEAHKAMGPKRLAIIATDIFLAFSGSGALFASAPLGAVTLVVLLRRDNHGAGPPPRLTS